MSATISMTDGKYIIANAPMKEAVERWYGRVEEEVEKAEEKMGSWFDGKSTGLELAQAMMTEAIAEGEKLDIQAELQKAIPQATENCPLVEMYNLMVNHHEQDQKEIRTLREKVGVLEKKVAQREQRMKTLAKERDELKRRG